MTSQSPSHRLCRGWVVYLTHANDEQEYNYKVRVIDGKPQIEVDDFKGTPEELLNYNP